MGRKPCNRAANRRGGIQIEERAKRKAAEHKPKNLANIDEENSMSPENVKSPLFAKDKSNKISKSKRHHDKADSLYLHIKKESTITVSNGSTDAKMTHNDKGIAGDKQPFVEIPKETFDGKISEEVKEILQRMTISEAIAAIQEWERNREDGQEETNETDGELRCVHPEKRLSDIPKGEYPCNDNIPPAPTGEKKRIKDFIRKHRYKKTESNYASKEPEFTSPDIQKLLKLPKGHHGNSKIVDSLKKKYEEANQKNKKDQKELDKEIRQGYDDEFILKRTSIVRELANKYSPQVLDETSFKKRSNDDLPCPNVDQAKDIFAKAVRLNNLQLELIAKDTLHCENVKDQYYRLLSLYQNYRECFNHLNELRVKERAGVDINVNDKQIKLLESIQRNLSNKVINNFSKLDSTPVKEWRRKLLKHFSLKQHLYNIHAELNKVHEKTCKKLDERNKEKREVEDECAKLEEEETIVCKDHENRILRSEAYQEVVTSNKKLNEDIEILSQENENCQAMLTDFMGQLAVLKKTPRSYDYLAESWKELKKSMMEQRGAWIERRQKQEVLKEMIRLKTGVILKEEGSQYSRQTELERLKAERKRLESYLKDKEIQRKKLRVKYKCFSDFIPLSPIILNF